MIEVDPDVRELLARWAISPSVPVSELTAEAVRQDDRGVLALQRTPGALHSVEDVEVMGPAGPLSVRVYRPGPGRLHPVLFLHGGGFVIGRQGYDAPLRELALASGCLIVAPESGSPRSTRSPQPLRTGSPSHGGSTPGGRARRVPEPPAVAGDSSGGNLAAAITHELARGGAAPSFQVLIYPMLDATASSASYEEFATGYGFSSEKSRWYFDQYLPPGTDRRTPRVSPLFDRDLGQLPATLVVTAQCDPLRDEGERYARNLREAGVTAELRRYQGMIHGFFQMTGALEGSRQLHRELGDWMHAHAGQARRTSQ